MIIGLLIWDKSNNNSMKLLLHMFVYIERDREVITYA